MAKDKHAAPAPPAQKSVKATAKQNGIIASKTQGKRLQRKSHNNRRINWVELKKEFFESKHSTLKYFLLEKGLMQEGKVMSGTLTAGTSGWAGEKRGLLNEQVGEIRELMRDNIKEYCRELVLEYTDLKNLALNAITERLVDHSKKGPFGYYLKVTDMLLILKAIKTELGEPTEISRNTNVNKNLNLDVLLSAINESEEPIDPNKLDNELYPDLKIPVVEIDGRSI